MNEEQRAEMTALNSHIYSLKRIIYSVEKPFRQESFDSYHKYVQKYINEPGANRYSEYEWCKEKLTGILANLDYRKAWGKVVGTNGLVLIENGVIIGLGMDSALRATAMPTNYANAVITPPGSKKYLPVGLRNVEPVYPDPSKPFELFPIPDGRLPSEVAADLTDEDSDSESEIFKLMDLIIKAALVLSPEDRTRLFKEIKRLQSNS